jgi:aromatic ring-cleaving dioxygenase
LGYYAHIYYDPTKTRVVAERVCAAVEEKFPVEIDGFRDTPVGPHPIANVLVIFKPDQFEHVVPYLMLNRDGLDVLVHPLTEDAVEDLPAGWVWLLAYWRKQPTVTIDLECKWFATPSCALSTPRRSMCRFHNLACDSLVADQGRPRGMDGGGVRRLSGAGNFHSFPSRTRLRLQAFEERHRLPSVAFIDFCEELFLVRIYVPRP